MTQTPEIAAIVLAAGRASRFAGGAADRTKLTEIFEGKPLVRHVVEAALASGAAPVVVVTGHARGAVMSALTGLPIREAPNAAYASGIASSVIAGIAAAPAHCAGALVMLADMPRVPAALVQMMIETFAREPGVDAVVPVVEGRRGNPVLLSRTLFAQVAALEGDEGARKLLMREGLRVKEVVVAESGAALDIDTPEALAALRASQA
ncbi:MAG: nucleotidyltransferase family protein [Hyphomicrobiales bacterium]|nr:nucleotidyltransferase family protein [Hyphomicrobiales bacterium]